MGQYFTIEELCASDTATRKGIDNTPTPEIRQNMEMLIDRILDPLRTAWKRPVHVTSGYRCPRLNRAVGGVRNSNHLKGLAADIRATGRNIVDTANNRRLFELIKRINLPYKELIWEKGGSWIHVSLDTSKL